MKLYKVFGFLFFGAILLFTSCQRALSEKIVIAVAANMQVPMEVIAKRFTEKHGVSCELIIGSSGKLTAQIVEGAPYDIFVAANMKYPRSEEHTSELQSRENLVCRLLLEKKKKH